MLPIRTRFTRLLAGALLAGCASAAPPSSSAGTPASLPRAWQDAFNRADTSALVALYAPDAILVPPGGTMLTGGRQSARLTLGALMGDRTIRLSTLHQRAGTHVGHLQGTWQAGRRDRRGPLLASGTYLMLFERDGSGRWSIAYHVWTQDGEPAPRREDVERGGPGGGR